jgi:hypothetical protein
MRVKIMAFGIVVFFFIFYKCNVCKSQNYKSRLCHRVVAGEKLSFFVKFKSYFNINIQNPATFKIKCTFAAY